MTLQIVPSSTPLAWHSHQTPYAAFVVAGGYVEAGPGGRRRAGCGDIVIHTPYSAHANWMADTGATLVNLPLSATWSFKLHSGRLLNADDILRSYADGAPDWYEYAEIEETRPALQDDLPDRLAVVLAGTEHVRLQDWAVQEGVSIRTLSRQFSLAYGISPSHFQWRARTLGAWREVVEGSRPLAHIAYDWSFSDHAHMTRSIVRLTGHSPSQWRLQSPLTD